MNLTFLLLVAVCYDLFGVDYSLIGPSPAPAPAQATAPVEAVTVARQPMTPEQVYEAARLKHLESGEPLLVLVGMKSCVPCQEAKSILSGLSCYIDCEESPGLAATVLGEAPKQVPVLVAFYRRPDVHRQEFRGQQLFEFLEGRKGQE